jgi:hypothetical protein
MVICIPDNFIKIKNKDKELLYGKMAKFISGLFSKTKGMDMEHYFM